MLSIQIIMLMLLSAVNSAFICPNQQISRLHDYNSIKGMSSRRFDHVLQIHRPQMRKTSIVLQGSLRDILNDGPVSATKSDVNSLIDTVEKRQKLTNQLQNSSTQEIKRELEQTYRISTAALRGKDQLITALVMARLNGSLSVPPTEGGVDPNFRDQYQEPPRGASNASGSAWVNNANYQKDMELMGVGEIKRELQLYGISTDGYADKRELLDVLIRERQLRNIPTPSKRPMIEVNVVPTAASQSNRNSSPEPLSDDRGNESIRSPSKMAELTKVTVLTKNQKDAKQSQPMADSDVNFPFPSGSGSQDFYPPSMPNPFFADEKNPMSDFVQQIESGPYDGAKLRELQIAFEFERVQASLPTPAEIQQELASKFNIDVKYFMGQNEMAYALAVARVDDAIEKQTRRRSGKDDDGCVVSNNEGGGPISKNRNANFDGVMSSNFNGQSSRPECVDEGVLASREELISMEFQRLQPLDEYELSWELEAQYGIPAKHFLGKRELAYALAVERVDTAQKEADAANGNESDTVSEATTDSTEFAWMSDEDMMRMMEEEMMKEESPKQTINTNEANKFNQRPSNNVRSTPSQQDQSQPRSQPMSLKDMIRNSSKKSSTSSQQSSSGNFQYQGESLRERERRKEMSSQPSMGTVIGGNRDDKTSVSYKPPTDAQQKTNSSKKQSRPLSDVIKGSSKSSGPQVSRVRATTPPPRPKQQQRPPRSVSKASSPFDTSFGVGAWQTTSGMGNAATNAYQNNYGAQNNYYGAQDNYSMHPRSPFEVPPFPDPEIFNNRAGPAQPPPPPPYGPYSSQVYTDMGTSFEPGKFTPPQKHNVDSMMPPPPRGRKNANSRSFNIRDTEGPRPFVGSQTVMDQFSNSPPLQVEPPPRDENNPPPERPFEPAPFSTGGSRYSVFDDRPPREPRGSQWKTASRPPPRAQQRAASQTKHAGASPFDRVKDMFKNMATGSSDNRDKYQDQVKFKDDKVEVMNDDWSPFASNEPRQKAKSKVANVRFIDAELDIENGDKYQEFANAWKGGPKSAQSYEPEDIPGQTGAYQSQEYSTPSQNQPPVAMERAYALLANPEIQAIASKAKSHPKVREAIETCAGDPAIFGSYLEDPDIGPILQELKAYIL